MDDIITVADKKHQKHLEKCRIASAKWRRNNPAKARDALVKWRQNNKDKIRAQQARWRKNNKDKIRAINGRQYQNHKEKIKSSSAKYRQDNPTKCRDTVSRWCENNPGYRAKYKRERRLNDSNFRMIENIRVAMRSALVGKIKTGHTAELLGCSINELREHLERLFQSGMT